MLILEVVVTHKANAPAEVGQDQSRGGRDVASTDESTARRQKRQLKNVWYEDGGRYLYRYGANGSTVFDVWKLIGEPLPKRGRA